MTPTIRRVKTIAVVCLVGMSLAIGVQLGRSSGFKPSQTWRPITICEKSVSHARQDRITPVISERLFAVKSNGSMISKLISAE